MIESIEGNISGEEFEGEPWEYSILTTHKEVSGWLEAAVLKRTGLTGEVTSSEVSSSYGTCEICGSYSEDIELYVGGKRVYSGGDTSGMDMESEDYANPFIRLQYWLDGGSVDE